MAGEGRPDHLTSGAEDVDVPQVTDGAEDVDVPPVTEGPEVILTPESRAALFPNLWTRIRTNVSEVTSAVGREGAWAAIVLLFCTAVVAYGAVVTVRTWDTGTREFHLIPLIARGPVVNLSVVWYTFALLVGVGGWLLSGQVTKRWLRAFVSVSIAIAVILLITIGRNARVDEATASAESEARRLLAAVGVVGEEGGNPTSGTPDLQDALLLRLCDLGGLDDCVRSGADSEIRALPGQNDIPLRCLEGWTVGAFDAWSREASLDRRIAVLTALASCEINVVDPVAEEAALEGAASPPEGASASSSDAEAGAESEPASVSGSESAADAPAEDEPSADAIAAVRAALQVQRSEVKAHEAISAGADELLTFASGPTRFAEFRFSGIAWLVVLGAALFWYRNLEIRAGAHRLGPVDVRFESAVWDADENPPRGDVDGSGEARAPRDAAEAVFKESVIRNVPEPGAIPGGEALAPVGDIVAHSDVPQKALVGAVIDAARTVFAAKGGFTVIFSARDARDGHVAFVRLRDTRTGRHLGSYLAREDTPEQAARRAGFWVAGWIIARSDHVPSWARWSEDEARGFLRLPWVNGTFLPWGPDDVAHPSSFDPNAVNSMILSQRAYARQLFPRRPAGTGAGRGLRISTASDDDRFSRDKRDHFAALEDFARAVNREPRYPVARYRRSAVLGTMMLCGGDLRSASGLSDDESEAGQPATLPSPARLRYLFDDLILADRPRSRTEAHEDARSVRTWAETLLGDDEPREFPVAMRTQMLQLVGAWSHRNRVAVRWGVAARLRPSERFFWQQFRGGGLQGDWMRLLQSDLCICAERLRAHQESTEGPGTSSARNPVSRWWRRRGEGRARRFERRIRARALEPDSHWQIAYNLACLYSIRAARWTRHAARLGGRSDPEAERSTQAAQECRAEAMEWLERCLDRPASDQLVVEWAVADADLKAIRGEAAEVEPDFRSWAERLRSVHDTVVERAEGDARRLRPRRRPSSTRRPPVRRTSSSATRRRNAGRW